MRKNQIKKLMLFIVLGLIITSCASPQHNIQPCLDGDKYGFFSGLWHGLIIPFSWIGSLFSDDIAIYAVNNNGGWYDLGFTLGIGGLSTSSKR